MEIFNIYLIINFNLYIKVDEFESTASVSIPPQATDAKTLERLSERSYVRDWHRLGLTNDASFNSKTQKHDLFRITSVNAGYLMCRRYKLM